MFFLGDDLAAGSKSSRTIRMLPLVAVLGPGFYISLSLPLGLAAFTAALFLYPSKQPKYILPYFLGFVVFLLPMAVLSLQGKYGNYLQGLGAFNGGYPSGTTSGTSIFPACPQKIPLRREPGIA